MNRARVDREQTHLRELAARVGAFHVLHEDQARSDRARLGESQEAEPEGKQHGAREAKRGHGARLVTR